MCIGGQPEAPVNKPAYEPEDAYKHFAFKKEGGPKDDDVNNDLPKVDVKPPIRSAPTDKAIRM